MLKGDKEVGFIIQDTTQRLETNAGQAKEEWLDEKFEENYNISCKR